jgi:copper(I)-binding protein
MWKVQWIAMSRHRSIVIACAACLLAACEVAAEEYRLQSLRIAHAFARATPPGAMSSGAYLTIENEGAAAATLLSATSPIAGAVELHQMTMNGGVMSMRAVRTIEVAPGSKLELKPGGYHLMLLDLKQSLKQGEKFPLKLTFGNLGTVEVAVEVEGMGAGGVMRPYK